MINPTFCNTVTVYHQEKTVDEATKRNVIKWIRKVYHDCFFGTVTAQALNGTTLSVADSYIVRIPASASISPISPGDIVIKGEVADEVSDVAGCRATDVLNRYKPNSFTVRAFSDNTKLKQGAHYKLTGV